MGWTCQFDHKGFCKRVKTICEPGMKGCILQTTGITFSTEKLSRYNQEEQKEQKEEKTDFAALARSC